MEAAGGPDGGSVGDIGDVGDVGDVGFGFNGLDPGELPRWLIALGLWGRLVGGPWYLDPGLIGRPIGDWGRFAPLGFTIGPAGEAGRDPGPGPILGAPLGEPLGGRMPCGVIGRWPWGVIGRWPEGELDPLGGPPCGGRGFTGRVDRHVRGATPCRDLSRRMTSA